VVGDGRRTAHRCAGYVIADAARYSAEGHRRLLHIALCLVPPWYHLKPYGTNGTTCKNGLEWSRALGEADVHIVCTQSLAARNDGFAAAGGAVAGQVAVNGRLRMMRQLLVRR
jgi:hypothetical protein